MFVISVPHIGDDNCSNSAWFYLGEIKKAVERVSLSLYPLSHVYDVQW